MRGNAGSTARDAAGEAGETVEARRPRPWTSSAALALWSVVGGTCLWGYVSGCMSQETGSDRGEATASRARGEAASKVDATGGHDTAPEASRSAVLGAARTTGVMNADVARGEAQASGSGRAAANDPATTGAVGSPAASGAAGASGAASDAAGASEGGAEAGESLWVAVEAADSEAAARRKQIAGQARALMAEPRVLACLLGHVPIGVGRRTALSGSLVVGAGGEAVKATIREGVVPATARACVESELLKTRFVAGSQARMTVPLKLEIR